MDVSRIILAVATGPIFVFTGGIKIYGLRRSLQYRDHFGMSPSLWRAIGVLEAGGGVELLGGLAARPLGIAAGAGLCALMFGAVLTHLRARDPIAAVASASGVLLLASASLVCGIAA
ncbi:DoxX family protein [Streptomyces sp. NBC_00996]|uniref:DoxX family protein n=1 Tax=Streptomyces sp. NBC_00996 TaxID=2903710 RepID=UPI003870E6D9|nr:DoxX family protein [Streptomyces sp. NBC_00996]